MHHSSVLMEMDSQGMYTSETRATTSIVVSIAVPIFSKDVPSMSRSGREREGERECRSVLLDTPLKVPTLLCSSHSHSTCYDLIKHCR